MTWSRESRSADLDDDPSLEPPATSAATLIVGSIVVGAVAAVFGFATPLGLFTNNPYTLPLIAVFLGIAAFVLFLWGLYRLLLTIETGCRAMETIRRRMAQPSGSATR